MKRRFFIVIAIIIAAGGLLFGYRELTRTHTSLKYQKAHYEIDDMTMIEMFTLQKEEAEKKFIDKIVVINGSVKKLENQHQSYIIYLGKEKEMSSIQCNMDTTLLSDLKSVAIKDFISIKGVVTGAIYDDLFGTDIKLTRCIIIENKN